MPFYISTIASMVFACSAVVAHTYSRKNKSKKVKFLSVIFGACAVCFMLYSLLTILLIYGIS
ncbi:MAG: hypothetical protein WAX04_08175 [Oscillospiraceae bacterium]